MQISKPYHYGLIILHWIIGMAILTQLALGYWMTELPKTPPGLRAGWFNVHKSVGITIGLFILLRIIWRLTHRPPALPEFMKPKEKILAKLGHVALYISMVCVPLSGFLGSSFSKYPIKYFGIELPKFLMANDSLKEIMKEIHEASVIILLILIAIHVLAVLKHLLIDKKNILTRMWF
jgi:cytochrome b561